MSNELSEALELQDMTSEVDLATYSQKLFNLAIKWHALHLAKMRVEKETLRLGIL